jgi:hypothetical protein
MLQHSLRLPRLLIGRNVGRPVPNRFAYTSRYFSSKNEGAKSTQMVVQGLTMNYFWNDFIPACGGIEKVKDKTMTEVYKEFIHPKITDTTAFCEVISKDRKPSGVIDNPKYFISYLPSSLFLDVLTSVETHFKLSNPKGAAEMMNKEGLFIDLFSNTRQENSEGWVETVLTRYHAIKPTLLYLFLPFNNNLSLFHHNFAEIVSAVISPVPIQFVLGHHYHQKAHFLSSNSASSSSSLASGPLKELMNSLVLEEDLLLKIDNYQFHEGEKEFLNELLPSYYSKEELVSVATIRERVVHRLHSAFLSLTQLFVEQNALSTQEKYAWELAFANSLFRNGHYQEVETLLFNALKGLLNTSEQEISPEKKNALVQYFRLAFARLYLFDNKIESFQQYYNNYLSGVRENISSMSIKELKEFNDLHDAQKQVDLQQENEKLSTTTDPVNERREIPDEEHRLAIECKKRLLGEFDQETFAAKVKYSNLLMKREFSQLTGEDAKFILTLLADLEFINKHFSSLKSEESVSQYRASILAASKEIQEHINDLKFFLIHYYYQGGLKEKADPLSNSFFALYELINSLDFEETSVVNFFRLQLLPDEKKHGVIYEIFKTFLGTGSFEKAEIFLQNIFEIPPDSDLQSNEAKLPERTECSTIKPFSGQLFINLMIDFAEKTQRFPMFDSRYLRNPFIPDIHPTDVISYCNNRYSAKHNEASTVIIKMQMMLHFANFYYQIGRYSLCIDFCLENIGEAGQFKPESTKPSAPTLSLETNPLDRQPSKDLEQSIHSVGILTLLTGIPLCASFYQMSEAEIANDNLLQYYNHFLSSATSPMSVGSFSPDFLVQMAYIGWKKHDFSNAEKLFRSYIDRLSKKAGAEGSSAPKNASQPKKWISKPLYYNQSEALKSLGNMYLEQGEQRTNEAKLCMSEAQQILRIYFPEYQQQR